MKAQDGDTIITAENYDPLLVAKHRLYPSELELQHGWHDCMCTSMKESYTHLSYNTNNKDDTKWNQYGGIDVTLTTNMQSRMTEKAMIFQVREIDLGLY